MPNNIDKNKRIAKNTTYLYIRLAFVMGVTLYTTRVLLKALGVDDYGIYNVVCGFVSMFSVIQSTLSSGTSRFYNYKLGIEGRSSVTTVFNTSIRVQALLAIMLLIIIEIIGSWYINNKLIVDPERLIASKWIFQFSVFSLIASIMSTPFSGVIFAFEKMGFTATISIMDAVLKLVIAFIIQHCSVDKLILYGFLIMLISYINLFCNIIYCKLSFKEIYLSNVIDKSLAKSIFSFSGWLILDPIAYTLRGQGNNMILNSFFGPAINAAFALSNQINSAMDSFTSSFSSAFKPQLVQSYAENNIHRTKNLMICMSKITWTLDVMLCVPFIFNINFVLTLWLGEIPAYTTSFATLILIMNLVNILNRPITQIIMAIGDIKAYMIITSSIVCLNIPLSIIFLNLGYPVISVVWIMLILSVINQFISIYILTKKFPIITITSYIKEVLIPCILQLIMVYLSLYITRICINNNELLFLIFSCLVSLFATFTTAYFVILTKSEKEFLKNILVSIKKKIF